MISEILSIVCGGCGCTKPATAEFFPVEGKRLRKTCRPCRAAAKRDRRQTSETLEQRERRLAGARAYAARNADRLNQNKIAYRAATKDIRSGYDRARYLATKDEAKARAKQWREANRTRKLENNRRWAELNPEKAAEAARASKSRRRQNPTVRLSDAISAGMRQSLTQGKSGRRWQSAVGYSTGELVVHLERQFLPGMTWENYGDWHVDHILAVASFTFDSVEHPDFRACWALTNLRPLWAMDNIRKSDKRVFLI